MRKIVWGLGAIWFLACGFLLQGFCAVGAHTTSASVEGNPYEPGIKIVWPSNELADAYEISRKRLGEERWGGTYSETNVTVAAHLGEYVDSTALSNVVYVYTVKASDVPFCYSFILGGKDVLVPENRGRVILLVENSLSVHPGLVDKLTRLEEDLVGDGWEVARHDVGATNSVVDVKSMIVDEYMTHTNTTAVFLLGRIPIPYSGSIASDGHNTANGNPDGNHEGAWPADVFYGDINGNWTDTTVSNLSAFGCTNPKYTDLSGYNDGSMNHNVPGDGKYDQDFIPDPDNKVFPVELMVGRVDLSGMPAFGLSEVELIARYLDKDHAFRHGEIGAAQRCAVSSSLGNDYKWGAGGREISAIFGADQMEDLSYSWLPDMFTADYLCADYSSPCYSDGSVYRSHVTTFSFTNRLNEVKSFFCSTYGSWVGLSLPLYPLCTVDRLPTAWPVIS